LQNQKKMKAIRGKSTRNRNGLRSSPRSDISKTASSSLVSLTSLQRRQRRQRHKFSEDARLSLGRVKSLLGDVGSLERPRRHQYLCIRCSQRLLKAAHKTRNKSKIDILRTKIPSKMYSTKAPKVRHLCAPTPHSYSPYRGSR
jgi:hypothetical protein